MVLTQPETQLECSHSPHSFLPQLRCPDRKVGAFCFPGLDNPHSRTDSAAIAGRSGSRPERERLSVDSRKASTRREPELPAGSFLSGAAILERPPD